MSFYRTGIKPLVTINTLVFDNFIKVKTNFKIPPNEFIFDTNLINLNKSENSIRLDDLKKLKLNQSINSLINYHTDKYSIHHKVLSKISQELKSEIYTNTYFSEGFEKWIITNFVRKYVITGKELFLAMTKNNETYQNIWNEKMINAQEESIYFDYCNGFGLKNTYPVDIYKTTTELNLRRYVDRNGFQGYNKLIELFEEKIKSQPINLIPLNGDTNLTTDLANDITVDDNSSNTIIPSMDLKGKEINYYNHNDKKIYILDTDKYVEFSEFINKGIENKIFNLDKYFNYALKPQYNYEPDCQLDRNNLDNYVLTPHINTRLENISIANCIIFGESNIRYSDVEKLLSLIRFSSSYYTRTIDNFTIVYDLEQNIEPNVYDDKINQMEFCKYADMLECAKWLIQIMNQINPNQINHHNYHTIVRYCKQKDNLHEEYFNNLVSSEQMRIREITFDTD
jgi:hypothetical protein